MRVGCGLSIGVFLMGLCWATGAVAALRAMDGPDSRAPFQAIGYTGDDIGIGGHAEHRPRILVAQEGDPASVTFDDAMTAYGQENYSLAMLLLRRLAGQDYAPAMYWMGYLYASGTGVAPNSQEASRWYGLAARQNFGPALSELGNYYYGLGSPEGDRWAMDWYRRGAGEGDASGQYGLGNCFFYGRNTAQDYRAAARWYLIAAEQGHAGAQAAIGFLYYTGRGVEKDDVEALRWLTSAAEQGQSQALSGLGFMYYRGEGVVQDYGAALALFTSAAQQGVSEGQYMVGLMYGLGQGTAQDDQQAAGWYQAAAEAGVAGAQYRLGKMLQAGSVLTQDNAKAAEWYAQSARHDYAPAQTALGYMYLRGIGIEQSNKHAFKWYGAAAEQGDAEGQQSLAMMFETGQVGTRDMALAITWYERAALQGLVGSQLALGDLYAGSEDYAAATRWYLTAKRDGSGAEFEALATERLEFVRGIVGDGAFDRLYAGLAPFTTVPRQADFVEQTIDVASVNPVATSRPMVVLEALDGQSLLLEASADGSATVPYSGAVEWSSGVDEMGQPTLVAHADISERGMLLDIVIRSNSDPSLPASHVMEIDFTLADDFAGETVAALPGILFKNDELIAGTPLVGASARVVGNSFLFALDGSLGSAPGNVALMLDNSWMDIAIVYGTGRNAIVSLEKDEDAEVMFRTAFAGWVQ